MPSDDFSRLPNPFAMDIRAAERPRRQAATAALKFLLFVAIAFSVVLGLSHISRTWLLHRLTADLRTLPPTAQQARLVQIAELGGAAIEPLVQTLADEDLEVARTAYDLIRQSQNDWTVLGQRQQWQRHAKLIHSLQSIAVHLPDDRTGWATALLQQTILSTVSRSDETSRKLYRDANHTIDLLTLAQRSGPSILSDEPLDPMIPRRLTIRASPLPVAATDGGNLWTDWPPPEPETTSDELERVSDQIDHPSASLSRGAANKLQAVDPDEPVILRAITAPKETAYQINEIQSVSHLVDTPMEAYNDRSVMHWLGSDQQKLRDQAMLELISRGYAENEIAIATQLATADRRSRLELVDKIVADGTIDPRPWLWMMAKDEHREVRLRVISVLATMNDPEVPTRLRKLMADERDPIVAARLRRVLDLR